MCMNLLLRLLLLYCCCCLRVQLHISEIHPHATYHHALCLFRTNKAHDYRTNKAHDYPLSLFFSSLKCICFLRMKLSRFLNLFSFLNCFVVCFSSFFNCCVCFGKFNVRCLCFGKGSFFLGHCFSPFFSADSFATWWVGPWYPETLTSFRLSHGCV